MSNKALFTLIDVSFAYGINPVLQDINLCLTTWKILWAHRPEWLWKNDFS